MGCRVLVSELMENKLQAAREMGFPVIDGRKCDPVEEVKRLTDGKGADAVILAVAASKANAQALEMIRKLDGRVLFFGAGYPAPTLDVDSNVIHYRRMELIGTFGGSAGLLHGSGYAEFRGRQGRRAAGKEPVPAGSDSGSLCRSRHPRKVSGQRALIRKIVSSVKFLWHSRKISDIMIAWNVKKGICSREQRLLACSRLF